MPWIIAMDGVTTPLTTRPPAARGGWLRRVLARPAGAVAVQVGLQWLDDQLTVARVRHEARRVTIEALKALPAPATQRPAVLRALKQEGVLQGARIHLLLAPGQYDVHQLAAPAVAAEDMHDALRWQLRGNLGYPAEEALLDFAMLPQPGDGPARNLLLAVTAKRSVVTEAVAPITACGLSVDAVDVPEFAQRNLAQQVLPETNGSHAWLAFDHDTFLLTVHCLGELAFARRMLLPNVALSADTEADPVAHFVERVALQVQRSLDLFERQSGLPPVTQILVDPHLHAAAIATHLGEKTAVRTTLAASFDLLRSAAGFSGTEAPAAHLLPALGAALRAAPARQGA